MDIRVSGRNVQVRDDVKVAISETLEHVSKIVPDMETADVVFKEERNPRLANEREFIEITLEGHGHHVRCKATGPDQMVAVDRAMDKLGKQLRKLKTRLQRRNHGGSKRSSGKEKVAVAVAEPVVEEEPAAPEPFRIVKTKSFELTRMMPEEAVERMVLLEHDFFIFTSDETGRPCVVYQRDDGEIGLINAEA